MAPSRRDGAIPNSMRKPITRGLEETNHTEDFEAKVGPLYSALVRRLVLVVGNQSDAEDIAQDAYLKAFRAWERFDGSNVRAWLYTIALRLAFNHRRGQRRRLAALLRLEPTRSHPSSDPDLWAALSLLDLGPRTALLLNLRDGFTQAEIGRILSVPEGTVASWISRARAALRRELGDG
jgi:RNA polymerase sigma-70 factor, ECF subfamily